jgi:microcystin-dependent protein
MSIEVATYINDLQPVNPPSTDPTSQGDDHLRLIKQVLQNQFKNATRTSAVPTVSVVSTTGSVVSAMDGGVIFVSTAGGVVTLTLPSLAAGDAGWSCSFFKSSGDVNPLFVAPPSGTIQSGIYSVAKARRCIPGVASRAVWTGTSWLISRASPAPIGVLLDLWGTTLPPGFEWPNGQTLASVATNYPEYNAAIGSGATPDLRGFAGITLDNLGGAAAGRLPNGYISGSTLGATGGQDGVTLAATQMPAHNHTINISDPGHVHYVTYLAAAYSNYAAPASFFINYATYAGGNTSTGYTGITATSVNAGSGLMHSNLQPSVMLGKILVVE